MSNPMMTNTLWYKNMCVKITVYEQSTNNYEKAKWELDDYTIFCLGATRNEGCQKPVVARWPGLPEIVMGPSRRQRMEKG